MNKTVKIHWLSVFCILIAGFFLPACSDDDGQSTSSTLEILKTEVNITNAGGTATITTNQSDVSVEISDSWLTAQVTGTSVILTAAANNTYTGRTAMVRLSKEGSVQELPISQLGIINKVDIYSYEFKAEGETKAFLWQTDQPFSLADLDDTWLSYRVEGDSLLVTAAPISENDDSRSSDVTVQVGPLFQRQITFSQTAPLLSYRQLLGEYTLEYTRWVGSSKRSLPVTLKEKEAGKTFLLQGLPFDVVVDFDATKPGISIKGQLLSATENVWLAPWQADGDGGLIFSNRYGVTSSWNNDKVNIVFEMVPDGSADSNWVDDNNQPIEARGFILWVRGSGEYTSGVESRFVDMKFIKKTD